MKVTIKKLVVALESLGYQCQYLDGSLIASNGPNQLSFVEDNQGEAIGVTPANVAQALQQVTEQQVIERFSQQMLVELGYGEFSPSAAKPTGVDDVNAKSIGIKTGEQAVTNEQPQKGPAKPQDASALPGDFTGDSENNQPANVPSTGGDSEASKVGPHGAAKTGSPGPNLKGPEKTQAMKVGQSLMQPDAPEADKGDYEGSQVGTIGNVRGDGRGAGGAPSMGKAPAPLPTMQGAQTLAKIPGPGAGKMSVTKATVESVLQGLTEQPTPTEVVVGQEEQNEQIARQNVGRSIYVVSRSAPDQPWTLSGNFESTTPETVADAKESAMDFTQANPEGGAMVVFSEMAADEIERNLSTGQEPTEFGDVEITQGEVEEGIVATAGRAIGKAAKKVARKGVEKASAYAQKAVKRGAERLAQKGAEKIGAGAKRLAGKLAGEEEVEEGVAQAGDEQDEALINKVVESLPKSFGLMEEIHPGPYISRETFQQIDLAKVEEQLTPILARLILEQPLPPEEEEDEEDEEGVPPPPPPPPGEEEEEVPGEEPGDMPPEPGEDGAGMGGPEEPLPDEGEPPEGEGVPGAPIDVDVGPAPEPQPIGGEQGAPGIEPGAPEPQIPPEEMSRYQKAKEMCPDCDEREIEELLQVGIVGDLYQALVQQVMAQKSAMAPQEEPLVASQVTTKSSDGSGDRITVFERERRLLQAWEDDPRAFVDALVDTMSEDPSKIAKAASMILGINEEDFVQQDAQEARTILQGLGESIRGVRNQLQDIRLSSVGKIQALVGSQFARGAFASEAQQMMDHLIKLENGLNAFLSSLDRYESEFDQRYQGMVPTEEPGAAEAPPPEAGGELEAPPPPEAPGTMAPPGGEPVPETEPAPPAPVGA